MQKEYRSNALGLWPRFIGKIIGNAILVTVALFVLSLVIEIVSMFNIQVDVRLYFALCFIGFVIVNLRLIKDNPSKWQNHVTIDLHEKSIYIKNSHSNLENTILDYRGSSYSTEEIDSYSIKHYEAFYFNTYYLVKIYVKNNEINLLALSDAQKFTDLIGLLKDQLNIPIK